MDSKVLAISTDNTAIYAGLSRLDAENLKFILFSLQFLMQKLKRFAKPRQS